MHKFELIIFHSIVKVLNIQIDFKERYALQQAEADFKRRTTLFIRTIL